MSTKESIEATCPDCRGPLSLLRTDELTEITCLVGHAYSLIGLLQAHADAEEKALWSAVVSLRETAGMITALSEKFPPHVLASLTKQVEKKQRQAAAITAIIRDLEPFET